MSAAQRALVVITILALAPPLAAADASGPDVELGRAPGERCVCPAAAPSDPVDPVVCEVVRRLADGASSELVEAWLEFESARPERLELVDLVALQRAGAGHGVVRLLRPSRTTPGP